MSVSVLYVDLSVSVFACISQNPQYIFCTCYLWPWLGPPLTTLQRLCTSGFVDDVMFSHSRTNTDTSHWRIIHRGSPSSTGVMISAVVGCLVKFATRCYAESCRTLNRKSRHLDICVYRSQWRSVPVSQHGQQYLNSIRLQRC